MRLLSRVPGAADVQKEVFAGAAEWQVRLDRSELARYGLNVADVRDVVESAVGGRWATEVIEGRKRFAVVMRLPEALHHDRQALGDLQLKAPDGELVPLSRVAHIEQLRSPEIVNRENGQRRMVVQANVRGRDLGSFVSDAKREIEKQVALPSGYYYRWGGQFENQQRAMARLSVVIPVVVVIIFGLLFASFDSVKQALLILLNVPFASVGGIASLGSHESQLVRCGGFYCLVWSGRVEWSCHGLVHQSAAARRLDHGKSSQTGSGDPAETGADDRPGCQSRLCAHGVGHVAELKSSALWPPW